MSADPSNGERTSSGPEASDEGIAEIASCALDEAGVREQRARYALLAPSVTRLEREPGAVMIEFDEGLDRAALDEALAIERECCPFFRFDFDESERRLRTTVREAEQLPALDAIAHALGGARRATQG
jgi:hypothetical protein